MKRLGRRTWAGVALGMTAAGAGIAAALGGHRRDRHVGRNLVRDPKGLLDLPKGYRYHVIEKAGDAMDDGGVVPGHADGMGVLPNPENPAELVLLRNHELPYPRGGVTRVVVDAKTWKRVSSNRVLAGTDLNCAGGIFPGVGWVSCEESDRPGHGYAYLCSATAKKTTNPKPIVGYGRFRHEAVAYEPSSLTAYLTEDRPNGCLYRFVPRNLHAPFEGELQALAVRGKPEFDTSELLRGAELPVAWVPVTNPDQPGFGVLEEARAAGAAVIRRGEGIAHHEGRFLFAATSGGPAELGQIFELVPTTDGGVLRVLASSTDKNALEMPDNLTVAPWGDVFIAEDDGNGENFVRILRRDGRIEEFALNCASGREIAGVCFSPDARALFLNLYAEGITLAVHRDDHGKWPDAG
ncbi:MAG: DUF839 domain-containing protein [Polyangiales bacterium]